MSSNKIQVLSTNNIITNQDGSITILPLISHKNTLIWIHGLACSPQSNINAILQSLSDNINYTKVVIPKAPMRYVTIMKKQVLSWFDVKFRGEKAFIVPFDQAFSQKQVIHNYQKVLLPIIKRQRQILNTLNNQNNNNNQNNSNNSQNNNNKNNQDNNKQNINNKNRLIISGFSQGCGMALHCLYHSQQIDGALGIAGYLFPITNFRQLNKPKRIIYGLNDKLRPWEYTKITYQNKIDQKDIRLVEDMAHDLRKDTIKEMKQFFDQVINNNHQKDEKKQ